MIEAAAIIRHGVIWTLPRPARHHHIIWAMYDVDNGGSPDKRPSIILAKGELGFVNELGEFLNRKEAVTEARKSSQLTKPLIAPPNLYSEDLW